MQPLIEVVEVETEDMLALSMSDEQASSSEDVLTNRRRGSWGNLWEWFIEASRCLDIDLAVDFKDSPLFLYCFIKHKSDISPQSPNQTKERSHDRLGKRKKLIRTSQSPQIHWRFSKNRRRRTSKAFCGFYHRIILIICLPTPWSPTLSEAMPYYASN